MTNLKNMMKHPPTVALPRPLLGAHMCRKTLNGRYEEALITSVRAHERTSQTGWSAVMMTKNGVEFISGDIESRTEYDWMPIDWVFHSGLWYSPKLESTEEVEVMNAPEVADDVVILPEPWEGEKFMSWCARAMKTDDRLRILTDVGAQLSQTWKEKSFDKGITL